MVVEAEVKEAQGRPLFGVNAEVRSKEVKKSLTGPTLLEMSGKRVYQDLRGKATRAACSLPDFNHQQFKILFSNIP